MKNVDASKWNHCEKRISTNLINIEIEKHKHTSYWKRVITSNDFLYAIVILKNLQRHFFDFSMFQWSNYSNETIECHLMWSWIVEKIQNKSWWLIWVFRIVQYRKKEFVEVLKKHQLHTMLINAIKCNKDDAEKKDQIMLNIKVDMMCMRFLRWLCY